MLSDIQAAIAAIIDERRVAAQRSEYDWKVCVRAVGAAADEIGRVPAIGEPKQYCEAVIAALSALCETYHDSEGEMTSGTSDIGTIISRIERLVLNLPKSK